MSHLLSTRSLAILIAGLMVLLPLPRAVDSGEVSLSVRAETVVERLDIPWEVDFAPDGRLFITERPGRVRIVERGRYILARLRRPIGVRFIHATG